MNDGGHAVIRVEGLGKKYRLGQREPYTALRDVLARNATALWRRTARHKKEPGENGGEIPTNEFWALDDVTFQVNQGEVIGIIGRNGAGKSTLLKILSRITEPTKGRVRIRGLIASLLEVGTGFHPELTGRENIFLNGAILGMTRQNIRQKFDEIVAFAEVERFLDTPVKRYSSGMYVRLAFSVAAHLEPDILIIDEVLAVGDAAFQKKCLGKMSTVARQGRTVLFVSHNMGVISTLTERCVHLENGRVAAVGDSREIVEGYLMQANRGDGAQVNDLEYYRRNRDAESPVHFSAIRLRDGGDGAALPSIEVGSSILIEFELIVHKALQGANLAVTLKTSHGERVALLFSYDQDHALFLDPGPHRVSVEVRDLPLAPGQYCIDVGINQSVQTSAYDVILDYPLFSVVNNGQITHWLERPWGLLHSRSVSWQNQPIAATS